MPAPTLHPARLCLLAFVGIAGVGGVSAQEDTHGGTAESSAVELPATGRALLARYADPADGTFDVPAYPAAPGERVVLAAVHDERGDCGAGAVTRVFERVHEDGAVLARYAQHVSTVAGHDYTIVFPNDRDVVHAAQPLPVSRRLRVEPAELDLSTDAADRLDVTVRETRLDAEGAAGSDDACATVIRTYDIINWCEWDGQSAGIAIANPAGSAAGPRLDVVVDLTGHAVVRVNFVPTSLGSVGRWTYGQVVRTFDDRAPQIAVGEVSACRPRDVEADDEPSAAGCTQRLDVPFTVGDESGEPPVVDYDLLLEGGTRVDGAGDPYGTLVDAGRGAYVLRGAYPFGSHAFTLRAVNACGNVTEVEVPFTARDCEAPTPVTRTAHAFRLSEAGTFALRARDLDAGSTDDCGAVRLSFSPNPLDTVRALTCDDLGSLTLRVYASDEAGNQDYVETFVVVRGTDCAGAGGAAEVTALVRTAAGKGLEGVTLTLEGVTGQRARTDSLGQARFPVRGGAEYLLDARAEGDARNGVNAQDLYLLGQVLDRAAGSPVVAPADATAFARWAAADANADGRIDGADLDRVRALVFDEPIAVANVPAWRFYTAGDHSEEPIFVWGAGPGTVVDLLAVKVGDLDGSADVKRRAVGRQATAPAPAPRAAVEIRDTALPYRQSVELTVLRVGRDLTALQGVLAWDPAAVEVQAIVVEQGSAANLVGSRLGLGQLPFVYFVGGDVAAAGELVRLRVRALRPGLTVRSAFSLSPTATPAATAFAGGTSRALTLGYGPAPELALEQNFPNPVTARTEIAFTLPAAQRATLSVTDLVGRTLWRVRDDFPAGRTAIAFDAGARLGAGTYLYVLEVGDERLSRQLVVVE